MIQLTPAFERPDAAWTAPNADPVPGPARAAVRRDSETAEKIEQTIGYMMDHLDRSLTVATLAAMAHVSPSHYFALFKRRTGSAPMDYFIRLRMERARRLLDTTGESIKEIAARLGYEDQFYFSRVFKSVNRVAPSQYRELRKNSGDYRPVAGPNGSEAKMAMAPAAVSGAESVTLRKRHVQLPVANAA